MTWSPQNLQSLAVASLRMRAPVWLAIVLVVPLLSASSAATGAWTVAAVDPRHDNPALGAWAPEDGLTSCARTDLVSASVSFDGSRTSWAFTVADATATCGAPELHNVRFPLYQKGGHIVASVSFTDGRAFVSRAGATVQQDGDTVTVEWPGEIMPADAAFHMSAFVDNSAAPAGCVVLVCAYTFRDELVA
jgi:hypothetical protein